jgi:tRNA modification GTPase
MILDTLQQHGVPTCPWQELEERTADNLNRTEAARLLGQAQTVRTAAILLDQYHGAIDRAVEEACNAASGEVVLDELARWIPIGQHLVDPWRVVVAGPVNAGKSSLVNAIAGFQRSIVSPIPGTTRDVVSVRIALDGWPVELIDTAGLRDAAGSIEAQGIQLAEHAIARADLCLWLVDGSASPSPAPRGPGLGSNILTIINKIDLPPAWDHSQLGGAVRVSAQTGEGLAELCRAIAHKLVPKSPSPGAAVPFTPELCRQIEEARLAWHAGNIAEARRILQNLSFPRSAWERTALDAPRR